ncbi:MAG: methyltransferase domain-containing protein [Phycisphaerae bacterium]|nr:methyltransferase domain-containing protein [Phycisphaerae bacterium]
MPSTAKTTSVKIDTPLHDEHAATPPRAAPESADPLAWVGHFESIYADAAGDEGRIPWADGRPEPLLVAWLNAEGSGLVRPGSKVTVVGCGLGDDARELADRGFDVLAFDCSPTAVQWARRRHAAIADRFVVADLFSLPASLLRRADLVVEISTIQAVHPSLRAPAAGAIVSLARPRGAVLAIARARDDADPLDTLGPPFPLSARELADLMQPLTPVSAIEDLMDDASPPVRRLRAAFRRI